MLAELRAIGEKATKSRGETTRRERAFRGKTPGGNMSSNIGKGIAAGLLGLAVVSAADRADASGFQLREQSAEGLGSSFAGMTAKAQDASVVWYNPAAMTILHGNQITASATGIIARSNFSGSAGPTTGGSGGDAIVDAVVGANFAVWDFSKDLKFGIGITSPFGLRTNYDSDWVGRHHAIYSSLLTINVNPSVAYRLSERFSVGAGVQIVYAKADMSSGIPLPPAGAPGPVVSFGGDGYGVGFNLGALYEFSPTSRVGLSFRSQVAEKLKGSAETNSALYAGARWGGAMSRNITAGVNLPAMVSLGVYHELTPRWAVMADLDWTGWSTFQNLTVRFDDALGGNLQAVTENWRDTVFVALGAAYKLDGGHKLSFGVAYDQSPVRDQYRTARIPDSERYWTSVGYSHVFNDKLTMNFGYAHLFAPKVSISEAGGAPGIPTLTGEYSGAVDLISTGFTYKF